MGGQKPPGRTPSATADEGPTQRYAKLPDRIRVEDMITEQVATPPGTPTPDGRNDDWNVAAKDGYAG